VLTHCGCRISFRVELDLTSEALESMTFDSFVQAHSTDDKPYERPTTAASIGIPSTFPGTLKAMRVHEV